MLVAVLLYALVSLGASVKTRKTRERDTLVEENVIPPPKVEKGKPSSIVFGERDGAFAPKIHLVKGSNNGYILPYGITKPTKVQLVVCVDCCAQLTKHAFLNTHVKSRTHVNAPPSIREEIMSAIQSFDQEKVYKHV